jgi:hypothetical protein
MCTLRHGEAADESIHAGRLKIPSYCFHASGELYRYITLNLGARASGWYWGRVAGLMVRASHALLAHGRALAIC